MFFKKRILTKADITTNDIQKVVISAPLEKKINLVNSMTEGNIYNFLNGVTKEEFIDSMNKAVLRCLLKSDTDKEMRINHFLIEIIQDLELVMKRSVLRNLL